MKTQIIATFTLALSALLIAHLAASQSASQPSREQPRALRGVEIAAVIRAVEDEVYDYSQEDAFFDVGKSTEGSTGRTITVPLYINPQLRADGIGEVIYKDMPYGEILRGFHMGPGGLVVFNSDPQIGFPVTQPSHLTEFMDDDELRQDKTHWLHREFTIQHHPPSELVIQAAKRQLRRVGFSDFLSNHGRPRPK
jgi:hypothetical protein